MSSRAFVPHFRAFSVKFTVSMHLRAFPLDIREDFPSDALFQGISVHFRTIWKTHTEDIWKIHMRDFFRIVYGGICVIDRERVKEVVIDGGRMMGI